MRYVIILLLLFACSTDEQEGKLYTIKADSHESTPRKVGIFTGNRLHFYAKFDSTAIYDLDSNDQDDWNKLQGFSDCNSHHQQNSARIGWRWSDDRLQFGSYTYADGVREMEYLTDGRIGDWIECSITKLPGKYLVCVNGFCYEAKRGCNSGLSYYLGFYFGGDAVLNHDLYVWLK